MINFLDHIRMGFCYWDLLAEVAILAVIVVMGNRIVRASVRKRELENELNARSLEDAFNKN